MSAVRATPLQRPRRHTLSRLVAIAAVAAMSTSVVAIGQAPAAHASKRTTAYSYTAFSYGTKVMAAAGELRSGRTAPSWVGCTRQAGQTRTNEVLGVDAPNNNPLIGLGAITSRSTTFKRVKQGIAGGTTSTSRIASVRLGNQDQQVPSPRLTITGLTTTATAWATNDGRLHASTDSQLVDIALVMPATGTPLDDGLSDLLDLVNKQVAPTFDQLLALLKQNGGAIDIPGLGKLQLGYSRTNVGAHQAAAVALSLQVTLYGVDGRPGGADDSTLKIGRSFARVRDNSIQPPVMRGGGWAAEADLVGGTARIGDIVPQLLPCQGTDGQTRTTSLASASIPGVEIAGLQARANGRVASKGQVRVWTEGKVAHVALGSGNMALSVDGIVGRVNLATDRDGRVVRRDIDGTIPGVLTFQGQSYTLPLGAAPALPAELAQLISIETGVTDRSIRRGIRVTALRITVLSGTAAGTVVNLGNAKAIALGD
ncbi:hypothetical protein ISU10_02215 [Nocardioides agariphilus]|uniref:Uncharacterized protein n=1 Tax=Nocardioides agariphilus TaxID=433664 RepID=A0A930VKV2_9ACTN|nr:choice-of-anchor P family protein [Nocardioides agariphilus]MBF4766580.1 hypothetical protein [Nocardioides agariphilus]